MKLNRNQYWNRYFDKHVTIIDIWICFTTKPLKGCFNILKKSKINNLHRFLCINLPFLWGSFSRMPFFDVTLKFFFALKSLLRKALLADAARFLMTFQTWSSAKGDVTPRTYKLSSRHLMHLVFVFLELFRVLKFLHMRALMTLTTTYLMSY